VLPVTILLNHCSLRLPKKPRVGHEYAFRLNINSGPMTGKLIIDPVRPRRHFLTVAESQSGVCVLVCVFLVWQGSNEAAAQWLEALRNPAEYHRKHGAPPCDSW
jgi:hypothetical protein